MVEEYLEDFLWLSNQLQYGTKLLKEGQSYALPSPTPVNLEITGANMDDNGNYIIVVTCSTKPLTGLFGLISYSEEDWAKNYAYREQGWNGGIIKSYKGVRVTILFRTNKGDVVDTFIKPPYATVKRTITLPAPFSYVEATASLVFDVDEDRIKQTQQEGIVLTIALLGTYFLPYNEELAPLAAKLMKLSPSTMDYWITVSQIANVLQKMGKISLATTLATLAQDQLSKIPTASAQPITVPPPQTVSAEITVPPTQPTQPAKPKTKTTLTLVAYEMDSNLRLEALLKTSFGQSLKDKAIDFYVDNHRVGTAKTGDNGVATYDIPLPSRSVECMAEFSGDNEYDSSLATTSWHPPTPPPTTKPTPIPI